MQRRTFLQLLVAVPATTLIHAVLFPLESASVAPAGTAIVGLMRETIALDILRDTLRIRFDILTNGESPIQFGIDAYAANDDTSPAEIRNARNIAIELFTNELKAEGLTWNDLVPLPKIEINKFEGLI